MKALTDYLLESLIHYLRQLAKRLGCLVTMEMLFKELFQGLMDVSYQIKSKSQEGCEDLRREY